MIARRRRPRNNSYAGRVLTLSTPRFPRLLCFLTTLLVLSVYWARRGTSFISSEDGAGGLVPGTLRGKQHGQQRLAIIIPFVGEGREAVPPYLELFCSAAAGSAAVADFLIIHSGVLDGYTYSSIDSTVCPPNVKFISLKTIDKFAQYLARVVDHKADEDIAVGQSREMLAQILARHVITYPYVLVEFKPALGHIFEEFLQGYTHWGYSDLDILFGDLERWITTDEWNDFDIVTYGYGDQDRVYLRGQFTFHRNDIKINQIWRSCKYLSDMDIRFNEVISGDKHLHFESAEGCYSEAVLQRTDISVKYTVKAFTDIDNNDTSYSHGLYVGTGKKKDKTVLYKAGSKNDGRALERLPETWFENKGSIYANPQKPLLFEVGERVQLPVAEKAKAKCMYWAPQQYQSRLCLDNVQSTDTVYWINGNLFKQHYEAAAMPGRILTAPFFHFQEYKRYYRRSQLATGIHRDGAVRTYVVTKEGVIPIYPEEYKLDRSFIPSPLGQPIRKWNGVRSGDRRQLPDQIYCLQSGPRKFPPLPPAPQCQFTTSWKDTKVVEIISGAPAWSQVDMNTDVTLVLTLQILPALAADIEAFGNLLKLIGIYLDHWQGQPSVLLIHMPGATVEAMAMLRLKLGPGSNLSLFGIETCFVAAIFGESSTDFFSRKALQNMAMDVVPTRWYITGFELERGVVISHDTAFFAHRMALMHHELSGSVFVIPQFGVASNEMDYTLTALSSAKKLDAFESLSKLDDGSCEAADDSSNADDPGNAIFHALNEMWWTLSDPYMSGLKDFQGRLVNDSVHRERAKTLDDIQENLIRLLTEKEQYSFYAIDVSPILMVDNKGPQDGMKTSEIAREVEEFGGKVCYNGMRLAQLAAFGYSITVLPGAFGLSTPGSRELIAVDLSGFSTPRGASRCDGCFFFDEEHEDILGDISKDERRRPAKASLLWEHSLPTEQLLSHV